MFFRFMAALSELDIFFILTRPFVSALRASTADGARLKNGVLKRRAGVS